MTNLTVRRARLLAAASVIAALGFHGAAAAAQDVAAADVHGIGGPTKSDGFIEVPESVDDPGIIVRDGFSPNTMPPTGILDPVNINGVGQVVTDAGGGFIGTCTGTLINPRTVIFAAHCVNTRAASAYGGNTGGTGISVGFEQFNLPSLRKWLGLDGGTRFATIADKLYNVEQVWYDPRSTAPASCTAPGSCFLQADIALATLDTPAFNIPTWAMLFSPLTQQEHVTVTGYGSTGTHSSVLAAGAPASGGFRRRAAENLVSLLGSMQDRNAWLFGTPSGAPQMLYMSSFTDPAPAYNPAARKYDFGIFGSTDVAQPREATTGPGDSGGPLILDQKYAEKVILGVLSGGSRFFSGQPFGTYGTHSFYQPLYAYWDTIVANNPYVYATNKAGDAEWTDAAHWVQAMDPNYRIDVNGQLINGVPDTPGIGTARGGTAFGQVCFLTDCTTLASNPIVGDGTPFFVAGGPGSTNFSPNNVTANPGLGVRSRYFDVTLSAPGTTRLSNASVTIDKLALAGKTKLNVAASGSLRALGDFTQIEGWTNVDGTLRTGEALLVSGLLSGSGTFKAPFLTAIGAIIAPGGGDAIGTLTIDGNAILSSGSTLFIDTGRAGADRLAVTGFLSLSDATDPASKGATVFFNKAKGAAPRHGDSFTIASAIGGVQGQFGSVQSNTGVIRPYLTYTPDSVIADLRAGKLANHIEGADATALAFAKALDTLREGSYASLYNLYGTIDLMDGQSLSSSLASLSPRIAGESQSLQDRQSRVLLGGVTDRLSMLGTPSAAGLTMVGSPYAAMGSGTVSRAQTQRMGMADLTVAPRTMNTLPKGMSGFVSGGTIAATSGYGASAGGAASTSLYYAMGLETPIAENLTFGTAVGFARGSSNPGIDTAEARTSQVAAYGSYQLGDGTYLGAAAATERTRTTLSRGSGDGVSNFALRGAGRSSRYSGLVEAGITTRIGSGLSLTPRVQLAYDRTSLSDFAETGGETALKIDGYSRNRLDARAGAKLAGSVDVGSGWSFVPQLQADYVQRLAGGNDEMMVRFVNASDVGFALPLGLGTGNGFEIKGGARLVRGNIEFGAGVETGTGYDALRNDRAIANMTFRF